MAFYETICYFDLPNEIDLMVANGIVNSYFFVLHKKEGTDLKDHYHLLVECSNKRVLQQFLFEQFKSKVLILNVRVENLPSRVRYYLHDIDYLTSLGWLRIFHYSFDNAYSDVLDFFIEQFGLWDNKNAIRVKNVVQLVKEGNTIFDLCESGFIPINHIGYYKILLESRDSVYFFPQMTDAKRDLHSSKIFEDGNYITYDVNGQTIYDSRTENFGLGTPSLNHEIDYQEYSKRKWLFNHRIIDRYGHVLDNAKHLPLKVRDLAVANGFMDNDNNVYLCGGYQDII